MKKDLDLKEILKFNVKWIILFLFAFVIGSSIDRCAFENGTKAHAQTDVQERQVRAIERIANEIAQIRNCQCH